MDHKVLAETVWDLVGGSSNVEQVTHCATRLRFNLRDRTKVQMESLKATSGVLGVVSKDTSFQVIIGAEVPNVYKYLSASGERTSGTSSDSGKEAAHKINKRGNWGSLFVYTITGIFVPILPPLTAAGMLKALLAILTTFKLVTNTSPTYVVINFMADAMFYFMPIFLANSAAKKFNCNPYLAMMLGGILLHPNFINMVTAGKEAGTMSSVFAIPIYNATYSASVIPIILSVWFMSKVEPIADRISPKMIKYFTRPMLTILVSGIVMLTALGPIGYIISQFIASVVNTINTVAGWIIPTAMGAFLPFMVMVGIHHGLTPIGINNRMTIGYDTIVYPGQLASNVAQGAAALAVSIKSKNKELKQLSSVTGVTAVCGITEPVLFGVTMRIKTNLIAAMCGGGAGGLFMGLIGVKNFSGGSPGLLTLPSYIGLDTPMSNFYFAAAGSGIAFIVSFVIAFILYKDQI
ncbi:PTS beta-glucoside transporter subunit EIIBCA [Lacrimispora amygdalina]|uniref:PTS beta-glucoside transporter subunit EIIBCA n=1 Tax=Lacrimispora amygdalina TaxID=253257 RepID=A0A3E2N9L4_9FIRM|nr:PTS transporter subunit EIIC [Clostridium indicum]RFZ77581.1 PTS beta-glucoside transporter subunit EIIBCA [Clostridium indicum]